MVSGEQAIVNQLCNIFDEAKKTTTLLKAAESRVVDVYFVTIPETGGKREFSKGITKIDFGTGTIINPDGSIDYVSRKLDATQQKDVMHSISIHSNQDIKFKLDSSGQQTVSASFLFQLPYVTYRTLEIECPDTSNINIFACTNPQATLGNFKVTTISTIQPESTAGDEVEAATWDEIISLQENLNRIRNQIIAITGEEWGTVSNSIVSLFDTTDGHDHDGTDSKKIIAANIVNTPSGNIVSTEIQATINELDGQDITIQANLDNHISVAVIDGEVISGGSFT